jgi:transglutaminase-like putative cysteine protease
MAVLGSERAVEPGENASYSVSYNILLRPRSISELRESDSGLINDIPYYLREIFCVPSPPFLVWDEGVRRVALSLAGSESNVLRIVKRFVGWIWRNIRYPSSAHDIPYYPNETLKSGEGDCDDQAILFVTFCRILGIPAYVQIGCVYLSDFEYNGTGWDEHVRSELVRVGWHGWAIVYIPPWGWLPVDLTFVLGSPDDPTNAIRSSAVAAYPGVVQYANISRSDYVGSTRAYRDFLLQNDFYVFSRDEMSEVFLGDLNGDGFVNMVDLNFAARAFGLTVESSNWNGLADVAEPFDVINIADLTEIAREFGMPRS